MAKRYQIGETATKGSYQVLDTKSNVPMAVINKLVPRAAEYAMLIQQDLEDGETTNAS